jgi:hypothetical protein
MAELGSTSIDDLPISPQTTQLTVNNTGANNTGVNNTGVNNTGVNSTGVNDTDVKVDNPPTNLQNSQTTDINQVINGIQQASIAGMTSLPARDIPRQQTHITNDSETRANYIPEGPDDYIKIHQSNEDIVRRNAERNESSNKVNDIYDEMSLPLMIGVLYFMFQLPIVRKKLFKFLPMLFNKDGNPNLSGYIVNSVSFAALSLLMMKGVNYMSV